MEEQAPSKEQIIYSRGYDRGFNEGYNEAAKKMMESLGFTLTPSEEKAPPTEPVKKEETAVTPPSSGPVCAGCGHPKQEHEPLNANSCFHPDCKCGGFTNKRGRKIGPFRLMKGDQ